MQVKDHTCETKVYEQVAVGRGLYQAVCPNKQGRCTTILWNGERIKLKEAEAPVPRHYDSKHKISCSETYKPNVGWQ